MIERSMTDVGYILGILIIILVLVPVGIVHEFAWTTTHEELSKHAELYEDIL